MSHIHPVQPACGPGVAFGTHPDPTRSHKKGAYTGIASLDAQLVTEFRNASVMDVCHPPIGPCILSDTLDMGSTICQLIRFKDSLISGPVVDVFTVEPPHKPCGDDAYIAQLPPAGQRLISVLEWHAPRLRAQYPYYALHPILDTIASVLPGFDRGFGTRVLMADTSGSFASSIQDALAKLQQLRDALMQPRLAEAANTFERTYRNRRHSVHNFIAGSLRACSKLTFAHIVLGGDNNLSLRPPNPESYISSTATFHFQFTQFAKRRDRFLKDLQRCLRKSLLGYIWRMDHGPEQGLQLSLLLALNGHKHPQEDPIVREVGNLWVDTGHAADGSHWSQRAQRLTSGLEHDQLGLCSPSDVTHVSQQISRRLCHADRYFQLQAPKAMKSFRKHSKVD